MTVSDLKIPQDLATLGGELVGRARQLLEDEADRLDKEIREELEAALKDRAELVARKLGGEDVDRELAHSDAALASYAFVAHSGAARVFEAVLKELGKVLGEAARVALGGLL